MPTRLLLGPGPQMSIRSSPGDEYTASWASDPAFLALMDEIQSLLRYVWQMKTR